MTGGAMRRSLFLGPITRRAEDLDPFLRAVAGSHDSDPFSALIELHDPASVDLQGLPVFLSVGSSITKPRKDIESARLMAAMALEHAGARVHEVSLTALRWTTAQVVATVASEMDFASTVADILGHPDAHARELIPTLLAAPMAILRLAERAPTKAMRTLATRRLLSSAQRASDQLSDTIGHGVLLHPPFPRVAPRHYTTYGQPWLLANTAAFNILGLPVTQVPLGLGKNGLPLGVQVAAAPGHDHVCIRVALELERALGGWVPPPESA